MTPSQRTDLRPPVTIAERLRGRVSVLVSRFRIGRWIAAIAAALIAATTVSTVVDRAETARTGWGRSVDVVVARHDLATGHTIAGTDVMIIEAPAGIVPTGAITTPPVGRRVIAPVGSGEMLTAHRLTSGGGSTAVARLPAGTRGLTFERIDIAGAVGDVVEVHALGSGQLLARAVVIEADDEDVTVAVPAAAVGDVVEALSQGGVISALVP